VLHCVTVWCSVLQELHCRNDDSDNKSQYCELRVLQYVTMCCSALQCVAVCCSAMQRISVFCTVNPSVVMCSVYCRVLQCVAVCCSVLQCDAGAI